MDILVPAAQDRFYSRLGDWDAFDLKSLSILALAVASLGLLAATHEAINRFWWIPGLGLVAAGALLAASIWPRGIAVGFDFLDFHDKMRVAPPVEAARDMLLGTIEATEANAETITTKVNLFYAGLIVFGLSLVGCLPVVLIRPHSPARHLEWRNDGKASTHNRVLNPLLFEGQKAGLG